jgi:hypothetical protein
MGSIGERTIEWSPDPSVVDKRGGRVGISFSGCFGVGCSPMLMKDQRIMNGDLVKTRGISRDACCPRVTVSSSAAAQGSGEDPIMLTRMQP